jgi:hypothetical protein
MEGINKPIIKAIRSFNLSVDAITKLNQQAANSGVNRSAYIERLIVQDDHRSKVTEDIEAGIQTTLIDKPTPPRPTLQSACKICLTDNNSNGHLQFLKGKWTLVCPNGGI